MKALRYVNGQLGLADVPGPSESSEATVRVTLSGICNTDIEIVRGYAGFSGTLGHEFVGVVEGAPGAPELVGKRVVGEINAGCGSCEKCLTGDPRHCPTRTVLGIVGRDGAHAEYLQLPSQNLLAVPDEVSDQQAVFTEPLAAAYGITEQVDLGPDARVAVVGDGKLGILCAMSLTARSGELTLVGKHREKMGRVEDMCRPILLDEITPAMHGSFDVVVEASGSESGFSTSLDLLRARGKLVLKSTYHGTSRWAAARVVVDEITIVGSRCGRFAPALELLANKTVPVERLIDQTMPLSRGVDAVRSATEAGRLKILLDPWN